MDIPINTIYYLLREGLWNQAKTYAAQQYKSVNDPAYLFWKGYASYRNGFVNEAINDLNTISKKKEIQYAVVVALMFYHKQCQTVDDDALRTLAVMEMDAKRMSGDKSFVLLAHFYMLENDLSAADEHLTLVSGSNDNITCGRAWLEIYQNNEDSLKNAFETFESVLAESQNCLEALLGKARASELSKKFSVTLEALNEILVYYPDFVPALAEKCRLLMIIADWEQCLESVQKVLSVDDRNILAMKIHVFYLLAREGNLEEGVEKMKQLMNIIDKVEAQNADLYFKCAQIFSRVSGRDVEVLKVAYSMVEKAQKLRPLEADYAVEKANIVLMMGDIQGAFAQYQEATAFDESKIEPLTGMIQCRLLQGMIDDAEQQIEFVNEIQVSVGRTPEIAFLEAMLVARKPDADFNTKVANTVKTLDECLRLHIALTKTLSPGFEFYVRLNPDFLLSLCKEYLQWLEIDLGKKVETVPPYVLKGNKLLDTVTKQIPGLLAAHLLLAKGKLGAGEVAAALKHIERVIEINNKHMEASILYALISYQVGNTQQAFNCLEEAVANNFQVRENPLFMLVKGEIELKNGNKEAALQTLEVAYNLPGGKAPKKRNPKDKKGSKDPNEKKEAVLQLLTYGDKERCKLHILLARAYIANGRVTEAKNVMDEAIKNFAGTTEEANVLMTNAELAVASNDIKKSISILKAVDKSSSYFAESRKLMADIYLKHMMDRRHYGQCYIDIIDANPTYENYKLLGDALMKIQEPEDAVKAYSEALKLNNNDEELVRLIGKALMSTHDYNGALNYYEDYLKKDPSRNDLRLDMGKLCIQLGKFEKADQLLKVEIFSDEFSAGSLNALKRNVEGLLQIAKLGLKRAGKTENPISIVKETYVKAISMQASVIERAKVDGGNPVQERNYLAEIQYELGKYFSKYEKNQNKALELFESAWKVNNTCERYLLAMAETHMKLGDRDSAEMRCIQVLKLDPYNQFACLLISDLMMLKGEAIKAIKQFLMVLEYNSSNYLILSKLIDLMFRNGRGEEVKPILEKVQRQCPNPNDPGLCYCKGIYNKLSRSPAEALEEFFKSKKGNQFGEESIIQMVDLYLNPDQDLLYTSVGESGVKSITPQNLNAADNLIKELKNRGSTVRGVVSEAYVYMFQKNKMELAQTKLTEILKVTPDYVPALVAFVHMRLIQGKKDEAKNLLKQINQKLYSHEHADDIEEAWLLHADFCISGNNLQEAEETLKKCLRFNQSCGKAEEYLGLIREKVQQFDEATKNYEQSWKISRGKAPSVGFRLASLFLKSKNYIQCIEVCKKVLAIYPDFQKIEKDVYSKARNALRN